MHMNSNLEHDSAHILSYTVASFLLWCISCDVPALAIMLFIVCLNDITGSEYH